jgi:hypothetical protein
MFLDPLFSNIKDSLRNMQFFSHSIVCSCYAQRWCSSPMETLRGRAYCLKQPTQFSNLNMLLLTLIVFLEKLQIFSIHLKEAVLHKVDMLHLWKRWQSGRVLFKCELGSPCITRWKALLLVTLMLLLQSCSDSPLHLNGVIQQERWCCSSRKTLSVMQYSLKEQTEFTILTKLLDSLVSNIKDSLTKAAVFLPFTFMRRFCTKFMFLSHENTET